VAVILDVMMPGLDGWEVLQTLRKTPRTSRIPVVVCSVFNDPQLALSLGATVFLPKPVSQGDILGRYAIYMPYKKEARPLFFTVSKLIHLGAMI